MIALVLAVERSLELMVMERNLGLDWDWDWNWNCERADVVTDVVTDVAQDVATDVAPDGDMVWDGYNACIDMELYYNMCMN